MINTKKLDQFEFLTLFNFNHNYTSFVSQHIYHNIMIQPIYFQSKILAKNNIIIVQGIPYGFPQKSIRSNI